MPFVPVLNLLGILISSSFDLHILLKKIAEKRWFYPVALLLIGFVTYNYALTSIGYYWADWEIVMFMKLNPLLQFNFYAHDRPFPWTYQLIHSLVGSNPIGWHIIALLIRWAGTLFFVQSLVLLWPRYKNHFLWLGALLLVYPGFLQQSQAATKARHIMTFLLFALSIYLMALAVKRPKWAVFLFPLSWLATFMHLFTTEYFAGLEFIRPVLLWMLLKDENKKDSLLRRVAIASFPYLLITAFYLWCRVIYFPVVFQTESHITALNEFFGGFQQSFGASFLVLLNQVLLDLIYLTWQTWVNAIINLEGFTFQSRVAWFAFGLGILLTGIFALFHNTSEQETTDNSSPASVFLVGFLFLIFGALPIWAINEQISAGVWNDRFALTPMLGAVLMVMGFLIWFVRPAGQKLILCFLMVFSIAAQVWVVNVYRRDWSTQLDYYWQLYWRIPAMQAGTGLISFEQPSPSVTHYSDAGYAINVLYHYQTENGSLPYWLFTRRFNNYEYAPNKPLLRRLRTLEFRSSTSNTVAVFHQTGTACLRVLDTVYAGDPLFTEEQDILIPVSNLSRIIPDQNAPPPDPDIFGPEPAHTWCYIFQKADLARQEEDWDTVIALYKQAQQKGFSPEFGAEYIPFIEAYAQTGDWQKAYDLTLAAQGVNSGLKKLLCANWSRLSDIPSPDTEVIEQAKQSLSCSDS